MRKYFHRGDNLFPSRWKTIVIAMTIVFGQSLQGKRIIRYCYKVSYAISVVLARYLILTQISRISQKHASFHSRVPPGCKHSAKPTSTGESDVPSVRFVRSV